MTDEKSTVDQAVELVLFAPIGLALEARHLLPTFVERGRNQVMMAKMVGQFAVTQGQKEADSRLARVKGQAEAVLAELGLTGATGAPAAPVRTGEASSGSERSGGASSSGPAARSSEASADLAIADYDSLAASQVIPRLEGLSAAELEAVRAYEVAHRGRKTILGKVSQLTGE